MLPAGPDVAFTAIDWDAACQATPTAWSAPTSSRTLVKRLPNAPGVYRMMNAAGDVLYVGKARSLKKRVTNYAQGRFHTNRIGRMVRETATMEFVVTRTEIEALLLEANLIKRLRPRFNVLMRDDKSFPYIMLTGDHPSPGIFKHRGARSRKGDYFGPFASAGAVGRTINSLQRAFLLRTCTDSRLREPHAALPALPDQALLRPLHRRDRRRGLCRAGRRGQAISCPARARR